MAAAMDRRRNVVGCLAVETVRQLTFVVASQDHVLLTSISGFTPFSA